MRIPKSILAAILISAAIRIAILTQTTGPTYEAYNELTQIKHLAETGLPLINDPHTWSGATNAIQPLFYYLAAFLSILLPIPAAALTAANLAALTIPIAVYGLAKEITTQYHAPAIITLASAFTPLLYQQTTLTANPLSLAIPLLLGAYYYFLRLGKTPRDQKLFILLTIALAATHPLSLLLAAAMLVTLLLKRIQDIPISKAMTEATIFATFFSVWANLLAHAQILKTHGISAIIQTTPQPTLATAATSAGLITLFAATYAANNYLREETHQSAHATIALAATTLAATLLQLIPTPIGLLLLSLALLPLAAGAIEQYQKSKHRSRLPLGYTLGALLITLTFLATSAVPAIAFGYEQLNNTPTLQEQQLIKELEETPRLKTHWDSRRGDLLRYHEFPTASNLHPLTTQHPQRVLEDLHALSQANNPVRYIEILNRNDIQLVILEANHTRPITERCFENIPTTTPRYEVYRLQCVIT